MNTLAPELRSEVSNPGIYPYNLERGELPPPIALHMPITEPAYEVTVKLTRDTVPQRYLVGHFQDNGQSRYDQIAEVFGYDERARVRRVGRDELRDISRIAMLGTALFDTGLWAQIVPY